MTAVTQMRDIWHCYFMNVKYQCIAHSWYVCSILEYSDHTAVFSGLQVSIGLYRVACGACFCAHAHHPRNIYFAMEPVRDGYI